MNLDEIKQLIKLLDESGLDEMGIQDGDFKITLKRQSDLPQTPVPSSFFSAPYPYPAPPQASPSAPATAAPTPGAPAAKEAPSVKYKEVRSPMVGTFYRAPAPDANPYVQVGDKITKGKVLCIVEAMKLMNEIESDIDGTVVQILIENGKPVEYNQVLFLVE